MRRLLGAAAAALLLCTTAIPASAVTLDAGDIGQSGTTSLNGLVNGVVVPGLTGTLGLTFLSITGGGTSWNFSYAVDNTSSGGITSELSAFGLNTTPNVTDATATGLYGNDVSVQSQLSSGTVIDFCASAGNNSCSGGSSNGISPTDPVATGLFSLIFAIAPDEISLDAAFARYQAIVGNGFNGASGIGTNSNVVINPTGVPPVPLPGAVWLFGTGIVGLVALNRRRKYTAAKLAVAH